MHWPSVNVLLPTCELNSYISMHATIASLINELQPLGPKELKKLVLSYVGGPLVQANLIRAANSLGPFSVLTLTRLCSAKGLKVPRVQIGSTVSRPWTPRCYSTVCHYDDLVYDSVCHHAAQVCTQTHLGDACCNGESCLLGLHCLYHCIVYVGMDACAQVRDVDWVLQPTLDCPCVACQNVAKEWLITNPVAVSVSLTNLDQTSSHSIGLINSVTLESTVSPLKEDLYSGTAKSYSLQPTTNQLTFIPNTTAPVMVKWSGQAPPTPASTLASMNTLSSATLHIMSLPYFSTIE